MSRSEGALAVNSSVSGPTIGVRDSGVGGLTVARRVRETCPASPLLYFADTAHVPYGDRSPQEVRHYALSIAGFLIERGAQIVVFACNTTSAYALEAARQRFSVPIVGVIEPGARVAAAQASGPIGVLATQATVQSGVYSRVIREASPQTPVLEVGCPKFVPLVEGEQTTSDAAYRAAEEYLAPLRRAGADTVVLGCTHYPLLLPTLRAVWPAARFIDPAEAVAREVARLAQEVPPSVHALGNTCFVSGASEGVHHWASQLLPQWHPQFVAGPVFDLGAQPQDAQIQTLATAQR